MTRHRTDQFLSILAHDLKGPLATLESSLFLLKQAEEARDWDQVAFLRRELAKMTGRTSRLLDSLLEWGREKTAPPGEAGESLGERTRSSSPRARRASLALEDIAEEVESLLEDQIRDKAIRVTHHFFVQDVPPRERAVVAFLMRNLLTNAVKYSEVGGEIRLEAQRHRGYLEISVSDEGVGMDPGTLEKVRRGCEVASRQGTKEETGCGMGLSLCRQMVIEGGGAMTVDSAPRRGTTFRMFLAESA